jgi:hemolysin activation/secretion protein
MRALALCLGVALLVSWGTRLSAQEFRQYKDYDRYRYLPRLPQGTEDPPRLPDTPREVTGDTTVLVAELKGLIFLDDPQQVVVGKLNTTGVLVRGPSLELLRSPAFEQVAGAYLGGPVSIRRLNELVRDVILFYRAYDRPVVDVSVPEQDITDGVIQVMVTEGRAAEVRVEGPCYFNPCVLARQLCISPGDPIYESMLLEDLRWLYRNPFRRVELELERGDERGETDVIFNVYDRLPARVYGGYEDTGTRFTGLERTFYGLNWYNALWRDDQFGYQYTTSSDFSKLRAHSAFYSTALLNRDILTLYGTYAEFRAPSATGNTDGVTWQLLPRWYRELAPWGDYEHAVEAGFDFKQTNTNLEFGGFQVFANSADIAQFMVGYNGWGLDRWGGWFIGADTYYSPGGLGGRNNTPSFQSIRAFAPANYFYTRGFLERSFLLPMNLQFVTRLTGQLASDNLLPTEQLGFGGYNSIRGYDLYSVVGDSGYFINCELQTRPVNLLTDDDQFMLLGFYDFGDAYNHTLLPGEDPSVDLNGVGCGLRYQLQPNLTLRTDYGWQISQLQFFPTPRERWHVGVVLSY